MFHAITASTNNLVLSGMNFRTKIGRKIQSRRRSHGLVWNVVYVAQVDMSIESSCFITNLS